MRLSELEKTVIDFRGIAIIDEIVDWEAYFEFITAAYLDVAFDNFERAILLKGVNEKLKREKIIQENKGYMLEINGILADVLNLYDGLTCFVHWKDAVEYADAAGFEYFKPVAINL